MKTVDREKTMGRIPEKSIVCAERKADYGICTARESGCGPAQHVSWIQCGIRRSG